MSTISFTDLVKLLPRGDEFKSDALPQGLSYVSATNPSFVEPELTVQHPVEAGQTSVILISAPGAVGKSTLAAELAARTGAVIWDLSKMQVGTQTFNGTILQAYNVEAHGVLKRIGDGRWLFVLDALDEAQVRAGSQNFEAFLTDLATIAKDPRARPTLVLLARSDTALLIELVMESAGVKLARYTVDYFNKTQATSFIEKRLDQRRSADGKATLHRQQPKPFVQARDALFGLVYRLFDANEENAWQDQRVKDFLGYAPVLEALARYVDVPNYQAFLQELDDEAGASKDPWQFLSEIMNLLQVREQKKFSDVIAPGLAAVASGWSGLPKLYGPGEQCARVLRYSLRLSPPTDAALPPQVAQKYDEGLRTFLPDHPFLSGLTFTNVVFKEFVYAWGITQGDPTTGTALRTAMRDRESPFLPSPLFSRFVVNTTPGETTTIDGQDFGIVYESLLARSKEIELSLVENGELLAAQVQLGDDAETELELSLLDTGSGIHFWRRLNHADIDVPKSVRLGLPDQRFALGPSVDVRCGELYVQSEDIEIDTEGGVALRADSYTATGTPRLRFRDAGAGRLTVTWPDVGHPWATYRTALAAAPAVLSETPRGDALRKLVMMFRRQRTRKEATVKKARWSPDQLKHRDELLELAWKMGVLNATKNGSVELNTDFDSLKTLVESSTKLAPKAREFVTAYLGEATTARLLVSS
jgi:hypothetical protein